MSIDNYTFDVPADWCDYNQHFSDGYYLLPFSTTLDIVLDAAGLGASYRNAGDYSTYTVESRIRYLREAKADDKLTIFSTIKDGDTKRLFTYHEMKRGDELIATCDFVCLHVDVRIPKTAPVPQTVYDTIQKLKS